MNEADMLIYRPRRKKGIATLAPPVINSGYPCLKGGSGFITTIAAAASINDLQDNAFTVEGWFNIANTGNHWLLMKGTYNTNGWGLYRDSSGYLDGQVPCATITASSRTNALATAYGVWRFIRMTFDDAGDRKVRLYIDGTEITYGNQTAGVDAIVSDAAVSGYIGRVAGAGVDGSHGWVRWSNIVRPAGLIPRKQPPTVDANTVLQFNCTERAGSVLTDSSGNTNTGTISNGTWIRG